MGEVRAEVDQQAGRARGFRGLKDTTGTGVMLSLAGVFLKGLTLAAGMKPSPLRGDKMSAKGLPRAAVRGRCKPSLLPATAQGWIRRSLRGMSCEARTCHTVCMHAVP